MHDATLAEIGGMYSRLQKEFDNHGGKCLMDSAFSRKKCGFIIKSAQQVPFEHGAEAISLASQATSCRQAAEWGMRAFQGSFPRVTETFRCEETGLRKEHLRMLTLLFNFRANRVGMNQLASSFMKHMSADAAYIIASNNRPRNR